MDICHQWRSVSVDKCLRKSTLPTAMKKWSECNFWRWMTDIYQPWSTTAEDSFRFACAFKSLYTNSFFCWVFSPKFSFSLIAALHIESGALSVSICLSRHETFLLEYIFTKTPHKRGKTFQHSLEISSFVFHFRVWLTKKTFQLLPYFLLFTAIFFSYSCTSTLLQDIDPLVTWFWSFFAPPFPGLKMNESNLAQGTK